ncbi:serine protease persephone-like [Maniola hyperantus]|uniref:serine protease persephone-like n=1 Tax=Aphantopus hyperantus TaxID=2795564 RepID=UPI00156A0187|nr:serine protease persephone-like [Maniola hyperantus]XP_034832135.1 serine protease persephone-like [Maniola hyperantus]
MWHNLVIICNLLIFKVIIAGEVGDDCAPTEEISKGRCKLVTDCEVAINYIQKTETHPFSRCGFSGMVEIVCCPNKYTQPPKPNTGTIGQDKFGDTRLSRVADRECQKIVETTIPPLGLHIIGGESASLGEFPHMVALGYDRSDGYDFQCGGSLLSDSYILTAAHCVDTLDRVTPTIARMGVIELGDRQFNSETDVRIVEIITHPDYKRRTKYDDLALLKLEQPVQFSVYLNAICLYTVDDDPKIPLTITGWGKTSTTRDIKSTILLKANVTVVSKSKCGESYTNWRKLPQGISDEQICAGDPLGLHDTCQGDSGGPLQGLTASDGQFRLVAVTSFGRGCGSPVPGVYTRVSRYLDWIESVVWPNRT